MDAQANKIKNKVMCEINSFLLYIFSLMIDSLIVDNFHTLDIDTKFVKLMTCLDIQHYFCKILNKFLLS